MSDRIIIRDVLPERIQLREPAFYNGLSTYQLYVQETTEETPLSLTEWLKLVYGVTPEFNKSATHVQWRVLGSETWIDLFPLSDIKGDSGNNVQFQVSATHIQWRVVGDFDWINLIALSQFKGEKGDKGYTPVKGVDYNDGSTPYIGENGNWWIDGVDTGENAIAPTMSVIEQYVTGYAEPKRGIDDFYVSAAQVILINDIVNKVTAITGHSLVSDTEIAKIHSRNTDSTLLSENGLHSVYVDANGTFHVKNISQVGTTYETHAEQLFTTKNEIILRDGAIAGLGVGEYVGFRAKLYDGVNDGHFVFDRDGWARVGDVGALQKLATIEESPTNGHLMRYNTSTLRLESYDPLLLPVSTAASRAFVSQNGGTIYHITRWFTPTSALTIAANGLSATITSGQFTSGMTGAKLKLTGGVNEPIITYVSTNQINLSFAVDSSFFGQNVAVADWGVYGRVLYVVGADVILATDLGGTGKMNNSSFVKNGFTDDFSFRLFYNQGLDLANNLNIKWSSTGLYTGTKDLGIRRISDGLMEIYNGVTNGVLRDLKLRSLFADKIMPNSDTSGVVIRNAADTADVVKVDTNLGYVNYRQLQQGKGFRFYSPLGDYQNNYIEIRNNAVYGFFNEIYSNARLDIAVPQLFIQSQNLHTSGILNMSREGDAISTATQKGCYPVSSGLSLWNGSATIYRYAGVKLIASTTENLAHKYSVILNSTTNNLLNGLEVMSILSNSRVGILTTTPETTLDVNGTTTLRDWVYLNNGTHTGDALDDYRYKVLSGVLTFQKCTTANSVRGNGGWTTVSTI